MKLEGGWVVPVANTFDGVTYRCSQTHHSKVFNEWLDICVPQTRSVCRWWILGAGRAAADLKYIEATEGRMSLFDASLHHNFFASSKAGNSYDLTTILHNSLVSVRPDLAVTVCFNHRYPATAVAEAPVETGSNPMLLLWCYSGNRAIHVFFLSRSVRHITKTRQDGNEHEIFFFENART